MGIIYDINISHVIYTRRVFILENKGEIVVEILMTIAMLCQFTGEANAASINRIQLKCQQSYIHCVNTKPLSTPKPEALERCILERKL